VTSAIAAPSLAKSPLLAGISVQFATSAANALDEGAIIHSAGPLFVNLENNDDMSMSTKIAVLRRLLMGDIHDRGNADIAGVFAKVAKGQVVLVAHVKSADAIASLVKLKRRHAPMMKFTLLGAAEAWLVSSVLWCRCMVSNRTKII
jgi:hypothetical protein